MLITESQMGIGSQNILGLLDNMSYLTEAESVYAPAMVPIIENTDVQANLIRLEDMMSFSEANGIEDLGYALTLVCEASQIDPSTVAFTVQEESIIADPEIASLTAGIINEGVRIAAIPVNENHPAVQLADIAVGSLIESGYTDLFDYILQEITTPEQYEEKRKAAGLPSMEKDDENNSETDIATGNIDVDTKTLLSKVKNIANQGRDVIARFLARLRAAAIKIDSKIKLTMAKNDTKEMTIWQKIKSKIAQAISFLAQKVANAIGTKKFGSLKDHEFGVNDKTDWNKWKSAAGKMKK